ncbi:MAG: pilin [Myxococcales bacterium]|nr:pilin [Myxococcales bacterium]
MKVFCVHCGAAQDVAEASPGMLTCQTCGKQFSRVLRPAPVTGGGGNSVVLTVVAALLAVPLVVAFIGIVAAIAIPNFIRFKMRAKQTECRTQLLTLYRAEVDFVAANGKPTFLVSELGSTPPPLSRYRYFLSEGPLAPPGAPAPAGATGFEAEAPLDGAVGVLPEVFAGGVTLGPGAGENTFTFACLGNLDGDSTPDVWSISSVSRVGAKGEAIPPGQPHNDVNDLSD